MTAELLELQVNEPASEPVTVGAVTVQLASPKVLTTFVHDENVGVALAICAVADDVEEADPLPFVAVTVDFKYWPTSAATKVYVELVAPEIFVQEPPEVAARLH